MASPRRTHLRAESPAVSGGRGLSTSCFRRCFVRGNNEISAFDCNNADPCSRCAIRATRTPDRIGDAHPAFSARNRLAHAHHAPDVLCPPTVEEWLLASRLRLVHPKECQSEIEHQHRDADRQQPPSDRIASDRQIQTYRGERNADPRQQQVQEPYEPRQRTRIFLRPIHAPPSVRHHVRLSRERACLQARPRPRPATASRRHAHARDHP